MRSIAPRLWWGLLFVALVAVSAQLRANGGNPTPPPSRVFSWDKATSTPLDALPRFRQVTQSDHQGG
jgi:hypothetical protein